MNKNKTSRYFKYAIGEIILVVIGILIALQINNWNENRKIKKEEKVLLQTVLENLKRDSITIINILTDKNRILSVHKDLIRVVNGNKSSNDIKNIGLLRRSLPGRLTTKTNHPDLPNQVLDKTIKSNVLNYYQMVNQYEFIMNNYNTILDEKLRPLLSEKKLLHYGNQFEDLSEWLNRPMFFKELKNEELQQVLFNVGVKLHMITYFSDNWIKNNELLKKSIASYLKKS